MSPKRAMTRRYAPEAMEEAPHAVEWGIKADGETHEYDWAYFTRLSDARAYADNKSDSGLIVWRSELGDYTNSAGRTIRTWFYYWWTEAAKLGEVTGRGKGFMTSDQGAVVNYRPLDETDWQP